MAVEVLPGNGLTLLRSGVEYFPALEAAIRGAQREIFLETYIYAGDATGERITKALCEAARRGVAAHVLVDGFGSRDMPAEFARELRDAGARLLVFRPRAGPSPSGAAGRGPCPGRSPWPTGASASSAASKSTTTWIRR